MFLLLDFLWDSFFTHISYLCSLFSHRMWPHGLQHARPPCPSPSPGVCSNSYPLSQWCHPTIFSSAALFSYLQSFPASASFPRSQFFTSGAQSIGVSASESVLPMNTQDWFPLGWTGLTSMQSMDGISFSLKIEGNSDAFLILWINFVVIMLGEISQTQKDKYLMVPVMWGS